MMLKAREFATAGGTLACAVGIGFIMQSGDTEQKRYGAQTPVLETETVQADVIASVISSDRMLDVEDITLTSAQTESAAPKTASDSGVQLAAVGDALKAPVQTDAMPVAACEITATATASSGAMLDVMLNAPCLPNERVNVHHHGMIFTESTNEDGNLDLSIPAMARDAVVIFAFNDGDGAVAQAEVDDLAGYDRTALQWRGDAGFQVHAREFGANYGDLGHVWAGAPRAEGTLTQLGDTAIAEAFVAEVYSFPIMASSESGVIDMSVEAEVTAANCGLEIEAQSMEVTEDGIKTQDLTLAVPDCDALGDFLVLNNLVPDLKVASN